MDMAHHSLISSQEASSNSNNTDTGDDITEHQRRQLNQQTKEILNVNHYFFRDFKGTIIYLIEGKSPPRHKQRFYIYVAVA